MLVKHKYVGWLTVLTLMFSACGGNTGTKSAEADSLAADAQFARQQCGSCHLFPEPELLDKYTWKNGVLPVMGPKMGIFEHQGEKYTTHELGDPHLLSKIYPDKPVISAAQWQKLIDYYWNNAPENMPPQVRNAGIGNSKGVFSPMLPVMENKAPMTVFVKLDPKRKLIFYGEGNGNKLSTYDANLNKISSLQLSGAPSWMEDAGDALYVTTIGSIYPSNKKEGTVQRVSISAQGKLSAPSLLLDHLPRPAQVLRADLDGNGTEDWIVNGFGHLEGEFYWLPDGDMRKKKVLRSEPGAIKTILYDLNRDGKMDLLTLFCQAREGIYYYENQGNGVFKEQRLLEFSSLNGSSGFDLADMNGDGYPDIVYTAGDNADYSIVMKNFHGVYVYLNDGNNHFSQSFFYPINGCYKALVRDFDLDGDMDILTVSFFADYVTQPEEILVLFVNQGNMQFLPTAVDGYQHGRWLTADAADIDGDGDDDVILGNFSQGPGQVPREAIGHWMNSPGFIVLKNNTR